MIGGSVGRWVVGSLVGESVVGGFNKTPFIRRYLVKIVH